MLSLAVLPSVAACALCTMPAELGYCALLQVEEQEQEEPGDSAEVSWGGLGSKSLWFICVGVLSGAQVWHCMCKATGSRGMQ